MARMAARSDRNRGRSASPAMIARALQPAVEQAGCGRTVALLDQVHQQEGQIVEHVDAGKLVVELDAVEQYRAIRPEARCWRDGGRRGSGGRSRLRGAVQQRRRAGRAGLGSGRSSSRPLGARRRRARRRRGPRGCLAAISRMATNPPSVMATRCRGLGGSHGLGKRVDQDVGKPGRRLAMRSS